ncbi:MAG TPA: substrate-binding domain-containing protein [Tepidisphaeraceae bacterium]|nr:substrate-binding domain-containing protein [Tepidisphaeraceae bacterium]
MAIPAHKSRTVLVFSERVTSYGRAVFAGMAAYSVEHGPWRFIPLQAPTGLLPATLREFRADGTIVRVLTDRMTHLLLESGVPTVNLGLDERCELPSVALDDIEVGRIAGNHLLQEDLASFAYCGVPWLWYSEPRSVGFCDTIRAAGRTCASFDAPPHPTRSARGAEEARLEQWIVSLRKPVGVMACDDARARQVALACQRAGLRIPGDVAIVGAGNDPMICEITDPPLSSVALAAERVGYEAARKLAQLMNAQPAPAERTKIIPPVGMVARFSTHVTSTEDADVAQAMNFIRDHVQAGITVEDVLRAIPLSRRTLELRFRSAIGRSPAEEIRRVRIERAKRLLVDTDAGMAGVAQASGFSSANQLCETFRREAGLSPTRYRKQFRAG